MALAYARNHNCPHTLPSENTSDRMENVHAWTKIWRWYIKDLSTHFQLRFKHTSCWVKDEHGADTTTFVVFFVQGVGKTPMEIHKLGEEEFNLKRRHWPCQKLWPQIAVRLGLPKTEAPRWYREDDDEWVPPSLRHSQRLKRRQEMKERDADSESEMRRPSVGSDQAGARMEEGLEPSTPIEVMMCCRDIDETSKGSNMES
ncbi:hypothetical protein C8Q76DRAFT_694877 [Earliella scabrosa]|nr:hypothetical protein C8Q76DRAFT_694877 [Earliella scabrosa]